MRHAPPDGRPASSSPGTTLMGSQLGAATNQGLAQGRLSSRGKVIASRAEA